MSSGFARISLSSTIIVFYVFTAFAQLKKLTLEDIWQSNKLQMRSFEGFQWMKSGKSYSKLIDAKDGYEINEYDLLTDRKMKTIVRSTQLVTAIDSLPLAIDEYSFSPDEAKILIKTHTEHIYRYSEKALYFIFDRKTKTIFYVSKRQKVGNVSFSPDGKKLAFTKDNNLYIKDLSTQTEIAITNDGEYNKIINGHSDWVYEEELELTRAYEWSNDSKKIAFFRFDESQVKDYNIQIWGKLYPQDYKLKYPKAGEKNAEVSILLYDIDTKTTTTLINGKNNDQYIPRINWTQQPDILSVRVLNRNQDSLSIVHFDISSSKANPILTFTSKDYVEIDDNFQYLKVDNSLMVTNENDGFRHIYRYAVDGKLIKQITKGEWEVSEIVGIDEAKGLVFYTSKEASSTEKQLYVIDFEGNKKKRLSVGEGEHTIVMNENANFYLDYFFEINKLQVALYNSDGKKLKDLEQNISFQNNWSEYEKGKFEFGEFAISTTTSLNFWTLKPANFDSTKKYPIFMFLYGGPGSQQVLKSWNGRNRLWFELLAQKGYIVACVDNRGTGGKGAEFKKLTTRQLGKFETEDQIDFAKYMGSKPWVDSNRIGIFGWSYGGYVSSLAILFGADVFKMAIAVAPVTSWRFYDSIYTERFLKNPQDNTLGYDAYSPLQNANKLKGKYLLIHGTGDDNVHFQNAVEMENALIKAGKQFDSFYYPNRNHGISGGNTRMHLYQMMTTFIEKNL
ncbi:MAG: S9 family peptidase [Cytophagales bacterium]